jgi:hypothetical protein
VAGTRRVVRRSADFVRRAEALFPRGGSTSGQPSFEDFERGPLFAVEELFARAWDDQPDAFGGIRVAVTHDVPIFPAMVFYACEITDGAIEMLDVEIDRDYFGQIGDDPVDDG